MHVECPGALSAPLPPAKPPGPASAPPAHADRAARTRRRWSSLLGGARKPLLLVGLAARSLGRRGGDSRALRQSGIPALVTYKAKGVVPDDHPWFGGVFTNAEIERPLLDESDLLIGVGLDPVELLPRPWTWQAPVVSCAPWRFETRHVPFVAQHVSEIAERRR